MKKTIKSALRTLLFPSLPEGMGPRDLLYEDEISRVWVDRKHLPPGSADDILSKIPALADFYTVESLNEILDDFWLYGHESQQIGLLLAANAAVDAEVFGSEMIDALETEYDASHLSEKDQSLLMTRIFVRHNPNASGILDILSQPDAHDPYYAFVAKSDNEATLLLARQIFRVEGSDKKRWSDVRKIPVFLKWFQDVATGMNEHGIVSLVESMVLRLNALIEQGDESIQSTFDILNIPEKYKNRNLKPTPEHHLFWALHEFQIAIIGGNEGRLGSDGSTLYDDFAQSLAHITNAQYFVKDSSLLEELVWDLNIYRSLGKALGLAPNSYMMERIL